MRFSILGTVPLTLFALSACVSDSPIDRGPTTDGGDGGVTDAAVVETSTPDASSATLTLTPTPPFVMKRGVTLDVTIDFQRNGVTGPIALTATGASKGTTIAIGPVGDGTLTTQMKISTAADADVGKVTITLKAPNVTDFTFPLVVQGPSGALDTSFDSDGIMLDTSLPSAAFNAVATQPDGKIVVVGTENTTASAKWLVRRYNADGSPDTAFNQAITGLPTGGAANAVAIDSKNGRIVVAGGNGSQTQIMRFTASGAPDQSFDGDGAVSTNPVMVHFGGGSAAKGLAILSDSSILVAGPAGSNDGYVLHYLEGGALDDKFTSFYLSDVSLTGSLSAVFAIPNGIFVTGGKTGGGPPAPIAIRLQPTGARDLNFGSGGVVNLSSVSDGCSPTGAGIATGGDVMIVAKNVNAGLCETRVTTTTGVGTGYGAGTGGNSGQMGGATAGPNDSFYADGWSGGTYDRQGFIHRRSKNGTLDSTFGTNGEVIFEDATQGLGDAFTIAFRAITTQSDGRIVAVGQRFGSSNPGPFIYQLWP
jgi:uncharacterized delta-60 repeat protein